MKNLVFGHDEQVSEWATKRFGFKTERYTMAMGIVDECQLVGAVFFHAWNGPDVEISYYGPQTMTPGIVRQIAKTAVDILGVSRVTARTSRDNRIITRKIKKLGFEYEGIRHNAYGDDDAIMYGLYGEKLMKLAGKTIQ